MKKLTRLFVIVALLAAYALLLAPRLTQLNFAAEKPSLLRPVKLLAMIFM